MNVNLPHKSDADKTRHRSKRNVRRAFMDSRVSGTVIPAVKADGIRPGKTARDKASGAVNNTATNKAAKALANRERRFRNGKGKGK